METDLVAPYQLQGNSENLVDLMTAYKLGSYNLSTRYVINKDAHICVGFESTS